jgi:mitochondrial import receptor subunit TOM40
MFSRAFAECAAALSPTSPISQTMSPTTKKTTPPPTPKPKRTYPGKFSDMNAMAQMVLRPDVFDGCKFEIAKGFSEKFAVTHTLMLGSSMLPPPSGRMYQFGTRYTPTRESMLMGRLNPTDGAVKVIAVGPVTQSTTMQVNCDLNRRDAAEPIPSSGVANLSYKGSDYSMGFQAQAVEGEDIVTKFSYLQSLTSRIVAGAEGTYFSGKGVAHVTLGARYADADSAISANYSLQQGSANHKYECHYMKQVDQKVSLAASCSAVPKNNSATVSLGYVFNLQTAKVSAKMDSKWQMHATLEEHIAPGFSLLFSGMLDHSKEVYKFGLGLQVGQ